MAETAKDLPMHQVDAQLEELGMRGIEWRAVPTFNINSSSLLSNFAETPFVFNGGKYQSVEGFIQGLKFPEDSDKREKLKGLVGIHAKREATSINHRIADALSQGEDVFIEWNGAKILYRSEEHYSLIEEAIKAKFAQNPDAVSALKDTKNMKLTHIVNNGDTHYTSLPSNVFCGIIYRIRSEILEKD